MLVGPAIFRCCPSEESRASLILKFPKNTFLTDYRVADEQASPSGDSSSSTPGVASDDSYFRASDDERFALSACITSYCIATSCMKRA